MELENERVAFGIVVLFEFGKVGMVVFQRVANNAKACGNIAFENVIDKALPPR